MVKNKLLSFLWVGVVLLYGCSPKYQIEYLFESPTSEVGRQCIELCQRSQKQCQHLCENKANLCEKTEFNQDVNGNASLKTFHDPLQCDNTPCDCQKDYRACYALCGGIIKTEQRCIANCP